MKACHVNQGFGSVGGLLIAALVLGGCGATPPAETPEAEAPPAEEAHEVTLAEAVRRCQAIQESNEVPVMCSADVIEGVPTMGVAFRNKSEAGKLIPIIESAILAPFCDAAVAGNRRAQVFETIGDQEGRKLECEMRTWSDWVSLTSPLEKGLKLCGEIQSSQAIPMGCATDVIQGVPVLSFAFTNQRAADEYQEAAAQYIAAPFCQSANAAQLDAAVFQQVGNKMRGLACSDGKWSPWKAKRPTPPSSTGKAKATAIVWQ